MPARHSERHVNGRIGWLRAAILSANDGILSTASLVLGVAATHSSHSNILGPGSPDWPLAMSMAAGEYVSVHSQADTEQAELKRERVELRTTRASTRNWRRSTSLAGSIHRPREAGSHATDGARMPATNSASLETLTSRTLQAALTSAARFALGVALPVLVTAIAPEEGLIPLFSGTSLVFFALLGCVAARTGGAGVRVGAIRVLF